jgi:hypothetical protein
MDEKKDNALDASRRLGMLCIWMLYIWMLRIWMLRLALVCEDEVDEVFPGAEVEHFAEWTIAHHDIAHD